jgi:hypothetical protein
LAIVFVNIIISFIVQWWRKPLLGPIIQVRCKTPLVRLGTSVTAIPPHKPPSRSNDQNGNGTENEYQCQCAEQLQPLPWIEPWLRFSALFYLLGKQ